MHRARRVLRTLWEVPAAADPPGPMRRDWLLVGVGLVAAVIETVVRDMTWPALSLGLFVVFALALPWRRRYPLPVVAGSFGTVGVATLVSVLTDAGWEGLTASVVLLALPYALARWGSGRQVALGLVVMNVPNVLSGLEAENTWGDVSGGLFILVFAVVVGAEVRTLGRARSQQLEQARLEERGELARELHDTVAHHVSAIAVQAQAGQAVAPSDPQAAVDALAVIEEEASRTLAEMRSIVGALRTGADAELAPQPGVADLDRLARGTPGLPVEVELAGDLEGLRPSVDAALYRLAQESITNAVRHARNASRVAVRVEGDPECVRLTVRDDGDPSAADGAAAGFGLVGMAERATLLGGRVEAGPHPRRGWTVTAVLPRTAGS